VTYFNVFQKAGRDEDHRKKTLVRCAKGSKEKEGRELRPEEKKERKNRKKGIPPSS